MVVYRRFFLWLREGREPRHSDARALGAGERGVVLRLSWWMRIDVVTTFPEMFEGESPAALGVSIPGRAMRAGVLEVVATNIRDFAGGRHGKTDDRPFGGGPGMVMMCQPLWDAVRAVEALDTTPAKRILMTPQGQRLTQSLVESLAKEPRILLIAGHYEGIDERVIEKLEPQEVSIGDYVLSGGELAAMVLIDAVARLLPSVLGHDESAASDSFSPIGPSGERLLDCPHYTRRRVWEGVAAPEVLLGGDHGAVARWRLKKMMERTRERRPDLLGDG